MTPSISITGMVRVFGLSPDDARDLSRLWRMPNPAYHKALKAKRWTGGMEREVIAGWVDADGYVCLPIGLLDEVRKLLPMASVVDWRDDCQVDDVPSLSLELRPYQQAAVEALAAVDNGVLVAPTGAGKTATLIGLIARLRCETLVLAHTNALVSQWREVIAERLGEWGQKYVAVETVQSLAGNAKRDPKPLPEHGLLIIDEVHHAFSESYRSVMSRSNASRRYGCTATPKRGDGLGKAVEWWMGPIRATVDREPLFASGTLVKPEVRVIKTGFRPVGVRRYRGKFIIEVADLADIPRALALHEGYVAAGKRASFEIGGRCNAALIADALGMQCSSVPGYVVAPKAKQGDLLFNVLLDQIIADEKRNAAIVCDVMRAVNDGHVCLVLSQRKEHVIALCEAITAAGILAHPVHGDVAAKVREARLADVREGRVKVFAGTQVADEGLDLPVLDRLFLATPQRSENATVQRAGRIMRPAPGKGTPEVWDYVDEHGLLLGQRASRGRALKKARGEVQEEQGEL